MTITVQKKTTAQQFNPLGLGDLNGFCVSPCLTVAKETTKLTCGVMRMERTPHVPVYQLGRRLIIHPDNIEWLMQSLQSEN